MSLALGLRIQPNPAVMRMLYTSQITMSKVRFAGVVAIEKYPACLTWFICRTHDG
jgi:hypothetical protein